MRTPNTTAVVRLWKAREQAYEHGFEEFSESDVPDDDIDLSFYHDTARYANHTLPRLRALAGHGDSGPGTHTVDREVAVLEAHQDDDVPAEAENVRASNLLEEIQEAWRDGAYDALEGNEKYERLEA